MMIGQSIGSYQILSKLGAGGMGEVYRARDTKLDRDVAIKVLPESFAADADRVARFTREAKTLASLNHPNIAGIYGLEESAVQSPGAKVQALVMELVEGRDLSEIIAGQGRSAPAAAGPSESAGREQAARGGGATRAINIEDAIAIARQIIDALEAAHEQGIIHRDLKPQNIKVRDDGTVKVLDFGLAKTADSGPGTLDSNNSPTLTARATQMGMILGTAAYMSPEQARGRAVDKRTDVWAFGCVLFEMLSGRKAFDPSTGSGSPRAESRGDRDSVMDILAAVMKTEPDWSALPADLPPNIRTILTRCLVKDRKTRIPDFSVVRYMLDEPAPAAATPVSLTGATAAATRPRTSLPLIAACSVLAVATVALAVIHFGETPPTPPPEMRVDVTTPATPWAADFELSPDGSSIAFVAPNDKGVLHLWLRRLDQASAQMLAGTEEARHPFWSPDSKAIAYFTGSNLKRIDAGGGTSTRVTGLAGSANGGAWGLDDVMVFRTLGGLMRVDTSGGQPELVTKGVLGLSPQSPQFLPDGRTFLYYQYTGIGENSGLYMGSLDGSSTFLGPTDSTGRWLPPSSLAYVSQGRLVVRPIDLQARTFTGPPQTVSDGQQATAFAHGGFSTSRNGLIAFRPQPDRLGAHLAWFDRKGALSGTPIDVAGSVASIVFSPDGTRLAVDATINGNRDVWISDLSRGGLTRLTFHSAVDGFPTWTLDSRTIVFESGRKDGFDIYAKAANGAGAEEVWLERPGNQWPQDVSPDGKWLVYFDAENGGDLLAWPLPPGGHHTPSPVATTPFSESQAVLSPDGAWVAYTTSESGRDEVVVQAFPKANGKWQVSTVGGHSPEWGPGGRELYFVSDATMMAVTVRPGGTSFDFAPPVKLFDVQIVPRNSRAQYAVDRRGRFLINTARPQIAGVTPPITLLLNWRGGTR
jgi:serine/threonine protein kinase